MNLFSKTVGIGLIFTTFHLCAAGKASDTPVEIIIGDHGINASVGYFGSTLKMFIELNNQIGTIEYTFLSNQETYRVLALVAPDLASARFHATHTKKLK